MSIVDAYSREYLSLEGDASLPGEGVVRVLERLREWHGLPQAIQIDNGPQFTGRKLDEWAYRNRVKLHFIEPDEPIENAYIESFNGRLRDECLNSEWFGTLRDAQRIIKKWREDYNQQRPHSALRNVPPAVWLQQNNKTRPENSTLHWYSSGDNANPSTRVQHGIVYLEPNSVILQDEIKAAAPVDAWWFLHILARIKLSGNEKPAFLVQGDEQLLLRIVAPQKATF